MKIVARGNIWGSIILNSFLGHGGIFNFMRRWKKETDLLQ